MTKTAFLFPGQGSQTVGMGASLMASCSVARQIVEQVDAALRWRLAGHYDQWV
jgi:[acyl-carrier-protein] S-malonyltransferase